MLAPFLAAALAFQKEPFSFYPELAYDVRVPRPESLLGYQPGERHTTFRDQEQVVLAITKSAPERTRLVQYGKSVEGRPLRVVVVSSERNIARLDQIREEHDKLAHGKGDPTKTVPIIWINQCIHGDETASFETAMWTLYNLVAARRGAVADALDKAVVILNPVYNPDGHERYVVYYNSVAVGSSDPRAYEATMPSVMRGRPNHYRFDMNRDRVAFSQDETRAEFAEMLRWGPQVYIDQHGQVDTYFMPPEPMAINPNADRQRNSKWTEIFGRATAQAFDRKGFSYFTRHRYDFWYPGYVDESSALTGAIGMTHETDGGRYLATLRDDGTVLTLRHGMSKHFTSALSVVKTSADYGKDLLEEYARFKRRNVTGEFAGPMKNVVVTASDPRPLERLKTQLGYAGIESRVVCGVVRSKKATDYWTGKTGEATSDALSLIVPLTQPQAALAKALLEPDTAFEPEFVRAMNGLKSAVPAGEKYPGPERSEFYDFTGWSLPFGHGLRAFWAEKIDVVASTPVKAIPLASSSVGYALAYKDRDDALAVFDLLRDGVKLLSMTRPMTLDGREFPAGTFVALTERNDDQLQTKLQKVMADRGVTYIPLTTAYPETDRYMPGSAYSLSLQAPRIGVVMGRTGFPATSGPLWWLMEREFKLPFTPLNEDALGDLDLSRFNCIVLPLGNQVPKNPKFRDWIAAGNVAVSIGDGAELAGLEKVKGEFQSLPGSLFRADLDPRSFLSYGYAMSGGKIEVAVPVEGANFYKTRTEGGSFVSFPRDPAVKKLLTGWEWPDETERALAGTVWCQDTPIGSGHFIFFTQDPTERTMWPGLEKLILNAMLFGTAR